MKFLDITSKDLYQIFKDWKPALFLLIAPIIFSLMFGFMFGGFSGPGGQDEDTRLPVQIVGMKETEIHQSLLRFLESSSVIRVESGDEAAALEQYRQIVADEDAAAVIIIPEDFAENLQETGDITLEVILDENTNAGVTVQQEIQSTLNRLQSAADAAALAVDVYQEKQNTTEEQNTLYAAAFDQALEVWKNPSVTSEMTQTIPESQSDEGADDNAFAQSLPGMMAQFAIAGLIGAAEIIVQERKSGALDRLKTTAVSGFEIITGHWLAMFMMIFLQFAVLITFGQIFLRLNFFNAPLATFLLAVASCAFVASLGLLIGVLAKLPEHTVIFSLLPMFIFSGLGGAWLPLELLGESIRFVAQFSPVSWIMVGFKDILLRGGQLQDIQMSIIVLLGFALLFFLPALLLFYKKNRG